MKKHFFTAGAFALLGAGAAIWHVNQNDKLPIEQEYVLKPETHGMDCKSDDNLTACANEFGGRLDGLEYQKVMRSEEQTSELQSLMRISYAVFCLKKKQTRSD